MNTYTVARVKDNAVNWSAIQKGEISHYPWGREYAPKAFFRAVYIEGVGFCIRIDCAEEEPRAIYTDYMDPVYTDSCLEFFAAYAPGGYINCEVNSVGALLSAYGEGRENRQPLLTIAKELPTIKTGRDGDCWYVEITMYQRIIDRVYGAFEVKSGYTFRGNCYKCGDKCEIPHYGMWNKVGTEKPDFHRPEYFGEFIVE